MVLHAARRVALFLLVWAAAGRAAASRDEYDGPLLNGNFEDTPDRSQMDGLKVLGPDAIPYWKTTGFVEYVERGAKQGDMALTVPEGAHAVRLGIQSSIEQQLSVTPGRHYAITFSAARTCTQADERLNVSILPDGVAAGELPIQTIYSHNGWDSYAWAFKAKHGLVTLVIHHADDKVEDPACGPIVDNISIKTLNPPHITHDNFLRNGGFEEGPYINPGSESWGVLLPPTNEDPISPLPGWSIMSYSKAVKYISSEHSRVPHANGTRAVELVAGLEAALVQEVDIIPGRSYKLEFTVGDAANGCVAPMSVMVATAHGSQSVTHNSTGTGGCTRGRVDFTAEVNHTRVVFYSSGYHTTSDGTGTLCGPVIDDVSLVFVHPHARRLFR
ncbi:uncharacterized protein LOC100823957 [Brachypodium distachyon]|uniref:DUF642 domain-containing protein n=1 Tax=Brachypodium distachyon TaxID=15368 RepID=I1IZ81_BRADI|nr:uncharacterized protein LOC100823957 [Brachypodium distachyon]KQJ83352.1 hypothetical protein BRADI_5g14450v3 [Brachypodium distachyon]|eukprot:XP_003581384.1 uncharacterized protein LOC100823957 [Brachypodium distachyon]